MLAIVFVVVVENIDFLLVETPPKKFSIVMHPRDEASGAIRWRNRLQKENAVE